MDNDRLQAVADVFDTPEILDPGSKSALFSRYIMHTYSILRRY